MRTDLRNARILAGLSQQQLADIIGRKQSAISSYESGRASVEKDVAPALAGALGMPILNVLYGPTIPKSKKAGAT